MASSMAAMTMPRSSAFSRATASAICNSSSRLALTAIAQSPWLAADGCGRCRECRALRRSSLRAARVSRLAAFSRRKACATSSSVSTSFASLFDRQQHFGFRAGLVMAKARGVALGAEQFAAEALASADRDMRLDLDQMAGVAVEIGFAHQRPVDAGRGYLQPVGAIDGIGHVEHRRDRARDRFAILDRHGAVRTFRHDLDGAAFG